MSTTATIRPGQGILRLSLVDVTGRPIRDPGAEFAFRRVSDGQGVGDPRRLELVEAPVSFELPAFPIQEMFCEIEPERYRMLKSHIFRVEAGRTIDQTLRCSREPSRWTASFTMWDDLGAAFLPLKTVLDRSRDVKVKETEEVLATLGRVAYDQTPGRAWKLAKSSLLNLHNKLRLKEPVSGQRTWSSFLERILVVGRERMLALADPALFDIVRQVHDNVSEHAGYERTPAENHRRNVPPEFAGDIERMVSIKTGERLANLQLTVSRLRGAAPVVLDVDIDENGAALRHVFDLVKHKFNGGTHPYDIHDLLLDKDRAADLGYSLA